MAGVALPNHDAKLSVIRVSRLQYLGTAQRKPDNEASTKRLQCLDFIQGANPCPQYCLTYIWGIFTKNRKENIMFRGGRAIIIDPKKTEEFKDFLKKIAKDKIFWEKNKEYILTPIDKTKIDILFKEQNQKEENNG